MRDLPAPPDPMTDPTADPFASPGVRERLGTWMVVHPVQFCLAVGAFLGTVNGIAAWRGGETPGASLVAALAVGVMSFVLWGLLWRRVGRAASAAAEHAAARAAEAEEAVQAGGDAPAVAEGGRQPR